MHPANLDRLEFDKSFAETSSRRLRSVRCKPMRGPQGTEGRIDGYILTLGTPIDLSEYTSVVAEITLYLSWEMAEAIDRAIRKCMEDGEQHTFTLQNLKVVELEGKP